MLNERPLATTALVAILLLGVASTADADFQVTLNAGSASQTIVDGGAGDGDGTVNNEISVDIANLGGYSFKFTLGETNAPGGGGIAFINVGTDRISGSGATTVSIVASANHFTEPVTPPDLLVTSSATAQFLSGTTSGNKANVSYSAYFDTSDALATSGGIGTLIGADTSQITAPGGNVDLSDSRVITSLNPPYALTFVLQAQFLNSGTNKIDLDGQIEITPLPVPSGLILALTAMPALCLGIWRRRRSVPSGP